MSDYRSTASGGISVSTLLGVAFIVLKLTGHIDWPWVWVVSPFWIPLALALGVLAVIAIGFLISLILANKA